ncbi:hypothetical protein [Bradyrhizobium viridifuturi]|uniref:hypothetical protein n=1 Tax=Bradyrhizobium viridifuturi TaxID=1654716 RepID=UPI000FE14449|nr:hypothetical protein [Bradyrhizobium viridifuturi]
MRNALKQGRLELLSDGTLDPAQLGGQWFRNFGADRERCVKRKAYAAKLANATQATAQTVPADIRYGWDEPAFARDVTEQFGELLGLKGDDLNDCERIACSLVLHAGGLLQREAYLFGWREDVEQPAQDDDDPIGPRDCVGGLDAVPITHGLVRQLGVLLGIPPGDPSGPASVAYA